MGLDLNAYIEIVAKEQGPSEVFAILFFPRDYDFFAKLASFDELDGEPLFMTKGLPMNVSLIVKEDYESGVEDHSQASWLNIEELNALWNRVLAESTSTYLAATIAAMNVICSHRHCDCRFVFWLKK